MRVLDLPGNILQLFNAMPFLELRLISFLILAQTRRFAENPFPRFPRRSWLPEVSSDTSDKSSLRLPRFSVATLWRKEPQCYCIMSSTQIFFRSGFIFKAVVFRNMRI